MIESRVTDDLLLYGHTHKSLGTAGLCNGGVSILYNIMSDGRMTGA